MNPPFGDDPVCIHCGSKKSDGMRVAELQRQLDELLEDLKKAREEMSCANFNSAAERIDHAIASVKDQFRGATEMMKGGAA